MFANVIGKLVLTTEMNAMHEKKLNWNYHVNESDSCFYFLGLNAFSAQSCAFQTENNGISNSRYIRTKLH